VDAEAAGQRLGTARFEGTVQTDRTALFPTEQSAVRGRLQAVVGDLGVWGAWVPAGWRLAGALRTELAVAGRLGAPELTGELTGERIGVRNVLQGVDVQDGRVHLTLRGDRARIESAEAKAGGGVVSATGTAALGDKPSADLVLKAQQVQLLGRVDRRLVTTGEATVRLTEQATRVNGRFTVDEGLFDFSRSDAPTSSEDVVVVNEAPGSDASDGGANPNRDPAPDANATARVREVDLRVNLGDKLRVRGRGLDTGLKGELRLTTPNNRLRLNGIVQTTEGTFAAYGQRLEIDRGNLAFTGPPDNPRLDIEATRPNLDVRVGVAISGLAQSTRVRLFSEPEMSEIEKLSWLMLGRPSDGLGRNDVALLQRAALALLAGENSGSSDPVSAIFGLDDLSVRQKADGDNRDTVLSVGKQLHRRWYLGYERSLNATAGTFQLIYRLAQRFTLRAQSGLDNSVDIIWTWRWN
jgi:translocation and assembly module TamB